ncbi:hypothetical protein B0A55_01160 [Friedmanniomyces simplex]|uniref:DNA polymerase epsilon subunit D n=1 Tax=Friedmanniomyces simplex TaxID=329884 RepID=A0A4V5NL22_9PEZI|nr:hypothetical protein B0A55_01160 [Friedmanniomyces simplex]
MPPRKSNVSATSNAAEDGAEPTSARANKEGLSVEDLSLPKSMIARLAKGVLPANTQIHKDALLALHKSATVFVNYIASTSFENAQLSNKKTIMPPDVVTALKDAEFESFLPRLDAELKSSYRQYNDVQCDKRNTYRRKVKEDKAAVVPEGGEGGEITGEAAAAPGNGDTNGTANGHAPIDDERPAKKQKGETGDAVSPDQDAMDEDGPDDEQEDGQNADQDEEVEEESDEEEADESEDDETEELAELTDYKADREHEAKIGAMGMGHPEPTDEDIDYSDDSD